MGLATHFPSLEIKVSRRLGRGKTLLRKKDVHCVVGAHTLEPLWIFIFVFQVQASHTTRKERQMNIEVINPTFRSSS